MHSAGNLGVLKAHFFKILKILKNCFPLKLKRRPVAVDERSNDGTGDKKNFTRTEAKKMEIVRGILCNNVGQIFIKPPKDYQRYYYSGATSHVF